MEVFEKIVSMLKEAKVSFEVHEHEFVHRSEDAAKTRGTDLRDAAKALVLKTKSGKFFMLIVPGDKRADLKVVKALIGEKNCSLAHPDDVLEVTGLKIGSVPPFGPLFGLETYFEESLLERKQIVFSAGSHYKSISIAPKDLVKVLDLRVESFCK